ncbi:MAG: hypothetical protein Q8P58_02910 [Candidatus Adlerbacteria bacterium]|nr:hypothetical protein [Candidatus Adlerbacteria bacterium]
MLLYDTARTLEDKMWKMSLNVLWLAFLFFPLLGLVVWTVDPNGFYAFFTTVAVLSPLWFPLFLFAYLWISWIHYARHLYWFNTEWVLLEIQLPPEVEKSPLAVELFLNSLFHTGSETTFLHRIWQGRFRNTWSLEIASVEGRIGFYIHGRKAWQSAMEGRLYGQFPEAKIAEVEDYVAKIPYNNDEYNMWCGEYSKKEPQAAPIKTWEEFGLGEDLDEPKTHTDPLTNLLEVFSNAGKNEYMWMQVVMRAHAKEDWFGLYRFKDSLKVTMQEHIRKIVAEAAGRAKHIAETELKFKDEGQIAQVAGRGMTMLTEEEKEKIKAMERNFGKFVYECGVRVVYIAKKEQYKGITGAFLFRAFDAYKGPFNEIKGIPGRGMIGFDYPWEDLIGFRRPRLKNLFYFHSKYRAYFYVPYDQAPVFLSTEELATLWHFPNTGVETPGLNRVAAKVSEGPSNLPGLNH